MMTGPVMAVPNNGNPKFAMYNAPVGPRGSNVLYSEPEPRSSESQYSEPVVQRGNPPKYNKPEQQQSRRIVQPVNPNATYAKPLKGPDKAAAAARQAELQAQVEELKEVLNAELSRQKPSVI